MGPPAGWILVTRLRGSCLLVLLCLLLVTTGEPDTNTTASAARIESTATGDVLFYGPERIELHAGGGVMVNRANVTQLLAGLQRLAEIQPSTRWSRVVPRVITSGAGTIQYFQVGDLNGDGDLDVVGADQELAEVNWYRNLGNLSNFAFSGPLPLNANLGPNAPIAVADLNNDGHLDVLVATAGPITSLVWHPNLGNGTFAPSITLANLQDQPQAIAVADLDDDGLLDVASIGSTSTASFGWFQNQGFGNFRQQQVIDNAKPLPTRLLAADLDTDGDMDLVVFDPASHAMRWYSNNGTGNFSRSSPIATGCVSEHAALAVGDLDADDRLDVVMACPLNNSVAWWRQLRSGAFTGPHPISWQVRNPTAVAVADIDMDGRLDIITSSSADATVAWFRNLGASFSRANIVSTTMRLATDTQIADMDRDGRPDILAATPSTINWYPNPSDWSIHS